MDQNTQKAAEHAFWISNNSNADISVLNVLETSSFSTIRHKTVKRNERND
jgi:hypothetical protein